MIDTTNEWMSHLFIYIMDVSSLAYINVMMKVNRSLLMMMGMFLRL
jgi:hypothetical protein